MAGYTHEQIIELTAVKVQEIIVPKVEAFTDGVEKEVQKLRLDIKDATQFNSAMQKGINELKTEMAILEPMKRQVTKLYTQFCENGYMQKFNSLAQMVNHFMVHRRDTCPFAGAIGDITEYINAQRDEAVKRAEGQLHTREQDRKARRRWMIMALISFGGLLVAAGTLYGKIRGWW